MGDLIFVLPIFIIFFFILFQIFSLVKKFFDFIRKNFELTIEEADKGIKKREVNLNNSGNHQGQIKERIAEAEKESLAANKDRILTNSKKTKVQKEKIKNANQKKSKIVNEERKNIKNNKSSLATIFSQYNELEKAVIYNEILSKPKALKKE